MPNPLADFMIDSFRSATQRFTEDLAVLDHEDLAKTMGEGGRCAYDFIYEVAIINARLAMKMRGEDPGPPAWDFGKEWLKAPEAYRTKDAATDYFKGRADELMAEYAKVESPVMLENDAPTTMFKNLQFLMGHTMYHDAQLNFLQSLKGDMAVHWSD